jgi:glucosamine--fructose-6-phosphate aminotransferase (isomerizing)
MLLNTIEGPYLLDILDQPGALQRTWDRLPDTGELRKVSRDARAGRYRRILLTGMGSSQYSLYPLHLTLIRHGISSCVVETAELIHYQRDLLSSDSLLVAVSQSGQSAEIVALLEAVRGRTHVIAVTNNETSPLAMAGDVLLQMHAGPESTVSCKTFVCTLLLLEWLGAHLIGADPCAARNELALAAPAAKQYLGRWQEHVSDLEVALKSVRRIFITGRGPSLAVAETGGLILKESVRYPAEGMSCAAFRHGPFEVLRKDVLVVVLTGAAHTGALNRRLIEDVRQAGGRAECIDDRDTATALRIPPVSDRLRPIMEILPIEMMTLALGIIVGREPGKFELATKVTATE